jgi:Protein of unknown function (DUF433)
MAVHDRIEINPKIMLGKPVIRGTRIPVELIVRKLAEGADEKALLQAYPLLERWLLGGPVAPHPGVTPPRVASCSQVDADRSQRPRSVISCLR